MRLIHLCAFFLLLQGVGVFTSGFFSSVQAETSVPNVSAKPGLDTSRRVEMTCGGTKVGLICGYNQNFRQTDDRICSDNTLIFTLPDGNEIKPEMGDSPEHEAYTPISISCRHQKGKPNNFYIYTRYLNASYNCMKFNRHCNQEVVFTLDGMKVNTYKSGLVLDPHENIVAIEERDWDYPADFYADHYYEKEN